MVLEAAALSRAYSERSVVIGSTLARRDSYNEGLMRKAGRRRATPARAAQAALAERTALDVYREMWTALSPAERLRRSWRLRLRLKDIETVHDEKSLPEL